MDQSIEAKAETEIEMVEDEMTMSGLAKKAGRVTFAADPIKPFGQMFQKLTPLDFSPYKICFAGCRYCFAVLNRKSAGTVVGEKEPNIDDMIKLFDKVESDGYDPENATEWCLQRRFPIIMSNNVEPFFPPAEAKWKTGERILTRCLEGGFQLRIQTKEVFTSKTMRDLIIKGKDQFLVYVTVTSHDDDISKKFETNCIAPSERFRRIKQLTDCGVKVIVGLNPYVPEWVNPRVFFKMVQDAGVTSVMSECLHFSVKQAKIIDSVMRTVKANRYSEFLNEEVKILEPMAKEYGIEFYWNLKTSLDFYDGITLDGSSKINMFPFSSYWLKIFCHQYSIDNENQPVLVTWSDVDNFYSAQDEDWNHVLKISSIGSILAFDSKGHKQVSNSLGQKNSIKNIVRYLWNSPDDVGFCGGYLASLVDSAGRKDGKADYVLDENGDKVYIYDQKRISEFETEIDQSEESYQEPIEILWEDEDDTQEDPQDSIDNT
jgi:DNA repair photolyase